MAGSAESGGKRQPSEGIQRYPRDLLRQFSGTIVRPEEPRAVALAATEEDYGEIELSLGLSLGGCFGVNPARKRGLHRSSSVASVPILQQREQDPATLPLIKRTSSLPAEAEEEQRKRKELQCLRWMEAKRKKSEKMGSPRTWARDSAASPAGATYVGDEDTQQEGDGGSGWLGKSESELLGGWWAPNRVAVAASHGWGTAAAGRAGEGTRCFAAMSQGSVGSQGSSSSGLSDFGSRPPKQEELLGDRTDQWRSSPRTQSLPDLTEHNAPTLGKPMNCAAGREGEEVAEGPSPWKETSAAGIGGANGMRRGAMEEMPCVFTVGGGPSGRRVEGLLYRYGKGEEVRIVCVCHGRFFSPAEFVRHAGGGDVAHPLRHIIVNPSPPSFL